MIQVHSIPEGLRPTHVSLTYDQWSSIMNVLLGVDELLNIVFPIAQPGVQSPMTDVEITDRAMLAHIISNLQHSYMVLIDPPGDPNVGA